MSSDESENDEDYVPSDTGSVHSDSDSNSEAEDINEDVRTSKKRRKNQEDIAQENGENSQREKTEDELWNEFLGIDSAESQPAQKTEPAQQVQKNGKDTSNQSSSCKSTESNSSKTAVSQPSPKSKAVEEPKNLFDFDNGDKQFEDTESRSMGEKPESNSEQPSNDERIAQSSSSAMKKPTGVSSLLEQLSKDKKLTTLEKSRQDWEGYKSKEGINEELSTHNRGKGGYLEKKEFLDRSDYRQFEKERDMRLSKKRKSALD